MFKEVPSQLNFPELEKRVLRFWEQNHIFEKSVESRDPQKNFVFYEGPPTANGKPGIHHVISRTIKDFVCRFKTMQGYRVERKAGWDTHGLPVEIEVEKELGIDGKEQILEYGVEKFNQKCKENVFRYKKEWDEMTRRIGYWVDLEHPYITYKNEYIETVWWILNQFFKKNLMYEGHKIIPYCPRCETALSSHEVSLGYKEVSDPSVYVRMKVKGAPNTSFLVWTTTPWTLISNVALAVHPEVDYVKIRQKNEELILAEPRLSVLEGDYEILEKKKGSELAGMAYEPIFTFLKPKKKAYYVVEADFVTTEDGTGIVHIAPAFGEDDYKVGQKYGLPTLQPVDKSGRFTQEVTLFAGEFVKKADPEIIENLRERGILYKSEIVTHSYPHCWRCGTPLLYYAKKSWYVRTTAYKDRLIENNKKIRWIPREVGEGRFGEWLNNNVDWALSRDRFWGTPLNIWKCEKCGHADSIGSVEELLQRSGKESIEDLHKPYIDAITWSCPKCGGTMKREPEVIDVWFDSGSMPYAQWHYPFENQEVFKRNFPADFISEGIDQTRGWFYSLLAISTLLFDQPAYKTVLSIELILDKEGQKMSKSKGNAVNPFEVLERNGADPLRWYLLTVSPPWTPTRFDPNGVREVQKKFYGTLVNVYAFFVLYANIDHFHYKEERIPETDRPEIDRWILSTRNRLVGQVHEYLERYDVTKAARAISDFVVEDVSNWYVRRSRRRFWKSEMGPDKLSAYQTLYEVLLTVAKLMAPFAPFLPEDIYQNLNSVGKEPFESVHLAEFPAPQAQAHRFRDQALEVHMDAVRKVVSAVRSIRNEVGIKVRQPLQRILVYTKSKAVREGLPLMAAIVQEEVNVKEIQFVDDPSALWVQKAKPNFKSLGPKFGKEVKKVAEIISNLPEKSIQRLVETGSEKIALEGREVEIKREDVEILQENRDEFAVAVEDDFTVALDIHLTDELAAEGLAREFINRVQNMRKEAGFDVLDRISIAYKGTEKVRQAIQKQADYIKNETLAIEIIPDRVDGDFRREWKLNGEPVTIAIRKET